MVNQTVDVSTFQELSKFVSLNMERPQRPKFERSMVHSWMYSDTSTFTDLFWWNSPGFGGSHARFGCCGGLPLRRGNQQKSESKWIGSAWNLWLQRWKWSEIHWNPMKNSDPWWTNLSCTRHLQNHCHCIRGQRSFSLFGAIQWLLSVTLGGIWACMS